MSPALPFAHTQQAYKAPRFSYQGMMLVWSSESVRSLPLSTDPL